MMLSLEVFAEGNAPTDFDIELFSKATTDASPVSDRYRLYQWQHVNTQEIDSLDVPCVIEDIDRTKTLHVRITNNAVDTMHVTDIEIQCKELLI
jgi:hypothetical protein